MCQFKSSHNFDVISIRFLSLLFLCNLLSIPPLVLFHTRHVHVLFACLLLYGHPFYSCSTFNRVTLSYFTPRLSVTLLLHFPPCHACATFVHVTFAPCPSMSRLRHACPCHIFSMSFHITFAPCPSMSR